MRMILLTLLLLSPAAHAIEKCVMADKRILYSDTPCPPGSKRVGGVEEAPPPDAETRQRVREEREQIKLELERLERDAAAQREARAQDHAAEREAARRAEQDALMRRQTEALERLATEQANQPVYIAPPYYWPPHRPQPPIVRPPPPRPPVEEEKRYEMAPFPPRKKQ